MKEQVSEICEQSNLDSQKTNWSFGHFGAGEELLTPNWRNEEKLNDGQRRSQSNCNQEAIHTR